MVIRAISAGIALLWGGVVYAAQGANAELEFEPVPISRAASVCITTRGPVPRWDGTPIPDCQLSWAELGKLRDSRSLYEARYVWTSPEFSHNKVVSVIVFEERDQSEVVTPLLFLSQDQTYVFLEEVHLRTVENMYFLEVRQCLNGTGGCWQQFYRWSPGELTDVTESLRQEIRRRAPPGYGRIHGRVDLEALRGEVGLWLESDPNCCPSAVMSFSLSWTPAGFIITSSEVGKSKYSR